MHQKVLVFLIFGLMTPFAISAQQDVSTQTEKGPFPASTANHPLSWWTTEPLRHDVTGDLMIGYKAADGRPIRPRDFKTISRVDHIGEIAGTEVVQVSTLIQPRARALHSSFFSPGDSATWTDLLASRNGGKTFHELYSIHYDQSSLIEFTPATLHRAGPNTWLEAYDPVQGNGGECFDGYWWFAPTGVQKIDFSPLLSAIQQAIPAQSKFTSRCWALHRQPYTLWSGVQQEGATCSGCGMLGEVKGSYRIDHGVARPTSVIFQPRTPPTVP